MTEDVPFTWEARELQEGGLFVVAGNVPGGLKGPEPVNSASEQRASKPSDRLKIPNLNLPHLMENEDFHGLLFNLIAAKQNVDAFEAALDLYTLSVTMMSVAKDRANFERIRKFLFIAARDGAMSLYHFSVAFEQSSAWGKKLSDQLPEVRQAHP